MKELEKRVVYTKDRLADTDIRLPMQIIERVLEINTECECTMVERLNEADEDVKSVSSFINRPLTQDEERFTRQRFNKR